MKKIDKLNIAEEKKPWYQEGLQFKCTGCGKCCTGAPGAVWLKSKEIDTISAYLKISKEEFLKRYTRVIDGRISLIEKERFDCIFLEGKFCSVYPVRPVQCQTFPFWPSLLESKENWDSAKSSCEGISHQAPVISIDIIEKEKARYLEP